MRSPVLGVLIHLSVNIALNLFICNNIERIHYTGLLVIAINPKFSSDDIPKFEINNMQFHTSCRLSLTFLYKT